MLSEQVGKIEKRLDIQRTQLSELDENIDEAVNRDTVVELIKDMVLITPSCRCKKNQRLEESDRSSDHYSKCQKTISCSSRSVNCM